MKDLALGFGEHQLQPVVVTVCSVTDTVRDRKSESSFAIAVDHPKGIAAVPSLNCCWRPSAAWAIRGRNR